MKKEEIEILAKKVFENKATPDELAKFIEEFNKMLSEIAESAKA